MSKETSLIFAQGPRYMIDVVERMRDSQRALGAGAKKRLRRKGAAETTHEARRNEILLSAVTEAYERATQALRDVRHLLPSDATIMVDAILDSIARDLAERCSASSAALSCDAAPISEPRQTTPRRPRR